MPVSLSDGLWVDNAVDAGEFRKALGASLVVPAGDATGVAPRAGRLMGPGSPLAVTPTAPASMAVYVNPGKAHTYRGGGYGATLGIGPDGLATIPIPAAPATGSQWHRVYLLQRDTNAPASDTTAGAVIDVVSGLAASSPLAPAVPVGALLLADVIVPAGATSVLAAHITDRPTYTAPRSGPLPVASQAERVALQTAGIVYPGLEVLELDTGRRLWHDGTRFRYSGDYVTVADATGRDNLTAYIGLRALVTSTGQTWLYSANGAWDDVTAGPLPSISVKLSAQTAFGGLFSVPFDAVITAQSTAITGSPLANEWFLFDQPGRRIQVKRGGLYALECAITTNDGTASQYLKLVTMPIANTQGNLLAAGAVNANIGYNSAATRQRLSAGDYVGAFLFTTGAARQDDQVNGLRTFFTVTRLSA